MIEHISTEEGLSNKNVHCIFQDSYGFLWIGTSDGLNRYDGYEFVVYKNDILDTTSLSSTGITTLAEDKDGNIWVGTPNGLNLYKRQSDSFVRYTYDPENEYSINSQDDILAILIDHNNSNYIWIGTDGGGMNLLDTELQRFYNFKHDSKNNNSLSGNKVRALLQDTFGDFWIGTSEAGLNRINLDSIPKTSDRKYDTTKFSSIVFERYLNYQDTQKKSGSPWINDIYEDSKRTLWFLLSDSRVLNFIREKNNLVTSPYFINNQSHFHEMLEDSEGMLWFGAHNRVLQLNRSINKLKEYKLNNEGTRSGSNQGLCEDRAGNIWAATWDGIVRIQRDTPLFEHYYHNVDDPSLPASNFMYSFLVDHSGKVWIGAYTGLLEMKKNKNGSVRFINYSKTHQINKGVVWSLIEDNKGSIWAAIGYILVRIDPRTNSIVQYKNNPENSNALSFQKKQTNLGRVNLLMDDSDNLWISTSTSGISKVSLKDLYSKDDLGDVEFTNYFNDPGNPAGYVTNFIQDRSGNLWICTQTSGVIKFDPETETFKSYKQELNNSKSLSFNHASTVHEDNKGNIWIGTYGGGLNKFDRETESFIHLVMKNGLPSNIIRGILEDDNGNLWISTNRGLTKYNPENNKFRNYDILENAVSFRDTPTGKMYFGNDRGFNVFHPDSIKESSFVPQVVITKLTRFSDDADGKQIVDHTISAKNYIELTYKDDIISFEFAALSFNPSNKYKYSYTLEGLNNNWVDLGMKRGVTFTNLDPGNYTFKVKACNEDGVWCQKAAFLDIYISPPWWSTWWAYGSYGLLFISVLYGIRRFELNRRKEKEDRRILELENERKTKELEQARRLQLSMLPKEIPCLPNLDIAVHMKTATEVGGDYYDFYESEDNTLNIVIGDATGHGLDAGMMVSAAKGLFQNLASLTDLSGLIKKFNNTLISMHLQPMHMGIMLTRINGYRLEMVGAGMPSMLIYQNSIDSIRELESGGPPLGGIPDYKYETYRVDLSEADVILLLSDGFEERFNINKEMLGDDKAKEILEEIAGESSDKIIERFVKECDEWGGDRPQDDDVTFVVIKVK